MKTIKIYTMLLTVLIFTIGYGETTSEIIKEYPSSVNLSRYNSIYVGWFDLGANQYGHKANDWATENRRNNVEGLQVYLREALPGKKITGAASIFDRYPRNADLLLQFKLADKIKYGKSGLTPICELKVYVFFLDGKTGKVLYSATMLTTCTFSFSGRNWKANSFDGALDNEIFKLANVIASKFKSGK
jgi:hypothetical protein